MTKRDGKGGRTVLGAQEELQVRLALFDKMAKAEKRRVADLLSLARDRLAAGFWAYRGKEGDFRQLDMQGLEQGRLEEEADAWNYGVMLELRRREEANGPCRIR